MKSFLSTPPAPGIKLHVYLAGPDVFKPNPIEVGAAKKAAVEAVGCVGHFPMDPEIPDFRPDPDTARRIAAGNEELMKRCQVILVNMTPWHGPSMDVGTAFEAGFMSARAEYCANNVLIIGYYEGEVEKDFTKRVSELHFSGNVTVKPDGSVVDLNGNALEKFGLSENLMIPGAIKKTGGEIFGSFAEAVSQIQPLWKKKLQAKLFPNTDGMRTSERSVSMNPR